MQDLEARSIISFKPEPTSGDEDFKSIILDVHKKQEELAKLKLAVKQMIQVTESKRGYLPAQTIYRCYKCKKSPVQKPKMHFCQICNKNYCAKCHIRCQSCNKPTCDQCLSGRELTCINCL